MYFTSKKANKLSTTKYVCMLVGCAAQIIVDGKMSLDCRRKGKGKNGSLLENERFRIIRLSTTSVHCEVEATKKGGSQLFPFLLSLFFTLFFLTISRSLLLPFIYS